MPRCILLNDSVLSDAEHRPRREHDDIGYADEMCSNRETGVQNLQTGQDTKDLPRTHSTTLKYVMEMIPAGGNR